MAARTRSRFDRDEDTGPRSDVYTGLLALSLIAMIVSSLLLFLDYNQYAASKAPTVNVPQPKVREGVQTGQLPPLPPPAPVSERPFTRDTETTSANPVKTVGGSEEAQAPTAPAPVVDTPPAPPASPPAPEAKTPPAPAAKAPPAPEPVTAPPTAAPTPPPAAPVAPPPPPLPKSIRNLPN
jgi:hypothetical protein